MGLSIAAPLYRHLKHEGYVAAACDSRRASSTASGKLQFVAIKEGPAHERMLNNFFDPMMHISNHVSFNLSSPKRRTTDLLLV